MTILVGTASWTDKTLIESGWYPSGTSSAEDRLHYYASQFPLVEVDSSYYFMPPRANAERWRDRTPPDFTFNIKAFSLLTQHPTPAKAIPDDLSVPSGKDRVYARQLHHRTIEAVWDRFLDALRPLHDAKQLGVILFQFPPWFTLKRSNKEYILECADRAAPMRIAVEFRNESWMRREDRSETVDFLTGHDVPYVCVDMPQGTRESVPPVAVATATDIALIRLHGRAKGRTRSTGPETANYRYRKDQLRRWAERARQLEEEAGAVHVILRNAYRDYAVKNAEQMLELVHQ